MLYYTEISKPSQNELFKSYNLDSINFFIRGRAKEGLQEISDILKNTKVGTLSIVKKDINEKMYCILL